MLREKSLLPDHDRHFDLLPFLCRMNKAEFGQLFEALIATRSAACKKETGEGHLGGSVG